MDLAELRDRLAKVDWAGIQEGWGADTGRQIEALTSADAATRAGAIAKLSTTIYHQSSVFVISAEAVPFLVELLGQPEVEDKHRILALLTNMAANEPSGHLANPGDFVDVASLVTRAASGKKEPTNPADPFEWTTAAVRDGSKTYVALLADQDARVRAAAAFLLGFVGHPSAVVAEHVRARLETEGDARAKASELLALAMLGIGKRPNPDVARLEGALAGGDPPIVRLAAAIGLVYLREGEASESVRRALAEGERMPREQAEAFPWNAGDLAGYARMVAARIAG